MMLNSRPNRDLEKEKSGINQIWSTRNSASTPLMVEVCREPGLAMEGFALLYCNKVSTDFPVEEDNNIF